MTEVCLWQENEDGAWETSCGEIFELNDGTPGQNHMRYCCYCGKPIEQELYREPEED